MKNFIDKITPYLLNLYFIISILLLAWYLPVIIYFVFAVPFIIFACSISHILTTNHGKKK
jgi:hypothetical protein